MTLVARHILFLLISILALQSCDESPQTRKPRHSGMPGELIVVMSDAHWRGPAGDSLRAVLQAQYHGLPQVEPSFTLIHFTQAEMNSMLRHHRNILQVRLDDASEGRNTVTLTRDKWASNQLVFTAYSPTYTAWFDLLKSEFHKVVDHINQAEIARIQRYYNADANQRLREDLKRDFGIDFYLPSDCETALWDNDFTWIKRERVRYLGNEGHEITQGFFIYEYPYSSDSAFTQSHILSVRDSLTRIHVPGPTKNTYMTTEYRYPPVSQNITVDGRFGVLTRGLWRTENHFMGGPFVSLTTTNPEGDRILSISGFVFAPKFDKREYIREVEAILLSLRFIPPESETAGSDAQAR